MKKIRKGLIYFTLLLAVLVMLPANVYGAGKVSLNKKKVNMYVGKSVTLKVVGTKEKVTWTSSNKSIVTVNNKGKITAKKAGNAYITAKVSGKKYKCTVKVQKPYLNSTKLTLVEGETYTLKLTGAKVKSYTSGKKAIATVNNKGKITAKKIGKTTITVQGKDGKKYKCIVTVSKKPYLNCTKKILKEGETYTLKLTGTKAKSFKTDNAAIASVNSKGVITAKSSGQTVITVRGADGKKYKCTITVEKITTPQPEPNPQPQPEPEITVQINTVDSSVVKVSEDTIYSIFGTDIDEIVAALQSDEGQIQADGTNAVVVVSTSGTTLKRYEIQWRERPQISEIKYDMMESNNGRYFKYAVKNGVEGTSYDMILSKTAISNLDDISKEDIYTVVYHKVDSYDEKFAAVETTYSYVYIRLANTEEEFASNWVLGTYVSRDNDFSIDDIP